MVQLGFVVFGQITMVQLGFVVFGQITYTLDLSRNPKHKNK